MITTNPWLSISTLNWFPEDHPLFQGNLPMTIAGGCQAGD